MGTRFMTHQRNPLTSPDQECKKKKEKEDDQ